MEIPGVKFKDLVSYDGTRIRYQDIGKGPVIVLANGLGGTFEAWYYLISHLRENYRIISWDYRGLYDSGRPDLSRLTVADHVEDIRRILKEEKIDQALFAGWSMGTQVIFEFCLRHPKMVLGLVPICGAAGAPFDSALHTRLSRYVMPVMFRAQQVLHRPFSALMKMLVKIPGGYDALTATHLFWRGGHEVIRDLVDAYAHLDFEVYAQIMLGIGVHDARHAMGDIWAPTMIIAATADFFTPVKTAQNAAAEIPDCRLHILKGGTHYAPLEFPDRINEFMDKFIAEKIKWPQKGKS